jgi:hypothetical protein
MSMNLNASSNKSRRRYPRFRIPATFRVKARVRLMGSTQSHYLSVDNLSMGGAQLISHKGISFQVNRGDVLEILLYSGHLSLRCVAKVAQGTFTLSAEHPEKESPLCVQMGIQIIGIDERSRKLLADFLEKLPDRLNAQEVPSSGEAPPP